MLYKGFDDSVDKASYRLFTGYAVQGVRHNLDGSRGIHRVWRPPYRLYPLFKRLKEFHAILGHLGLLTPSDRVDPLLFEWA